MVKIIVSFFFTYILSFVKCCLDCNWTRKNNNPIYNSYSMLLFIRWKWNRVNVVKEEFGCLEIRSNKTDDKSNSLWQYLFLALPDHSINKEWFHVKWDYLVNHNVRLWLLLLYRLYWDAKIINPFTWTVLL